MAPVWRHRDRVLQWQFIRRREVCPDEGEVARNVRSILHCPPSIQAVRSAVPRYLVGSPTIRTRWSKLAAGTNINNLKSAHVTQTPVALPPLNEQRRIVAAIEEQFSRLDAADALLDAAGERLAVLSKLLDAQMLSGWETKPLDSLCPVFVDCAHRTPEYSSEGVPALRPRDVVGGRLRLDTAARVGRSEFDIQTKRRVPLEGDVVYSRELSFGWAVAVPPDTTVCLSQGMVLFRPGASLLPEFLVLVLNSSLGRKQAERAAVGSAHPHINLRDIRAYRIPVPPLDEQRRIAAEVAARLSAVERVQASLEGARLRGAALRRSILERAFRGELVVQDPSDEPASALLEHIRAERDEATRAPRRRRVGA